MYLACSLLHYTIAMPSIPSAIALNAVNHHVPSWVNKYGRLDEIQLISSSDSVEQITDIAGRFLTRQFVNLTITDDLVFEGQKNVWLV
jgi:hypothetical protein